MSSMDSSTEKGIKILKISLAILLATGFFQLIIFYLSGSAALLSDTIHNFADAFTAVPLWIAFALNRKKPTSTLTYGYGKAEDAAGIMIVIIIFFSGIGALYESVQRLITPQIISNTYWVMASGLIGFAGNEFVARLRIKTGNIIGSAALTADGKHAKIDGLTSLGVLLGGISAEAGFPVADPVIGIIISIFIFAIAVDTAKEILKRIMDAIDPSLIKKIKDISLSIEKVRSVHDVKARWIGHNILAEVSIAVPESLSVKEGHSIAVKVHKELLKNIPYLKNISIHVDPINEIGESVHIGKIPNKEIKNI